MCGDRATRLLPAVVLSLVLGLLGMHALVVVDTGHQMPAEALMSPPGATAPMNEHPASPIMASQTPAVGVMSVDGALLAAEVVVPLSPREDHSSTHQALHLCLAILAAVLMMLVAAAATVATTVRDDSDTSRPGRAQPTPPRRPPPTSVRLAQLCVMRN